MTFSQALPKSLSPSRLQDFQACPRRYQYASIERLPQPASYAATKGRFVHHVFEKLLAADAAERTRERALALVPDAVAHVLDEGVRRDLNLDEASEATLIDEAIAIVDTYFTMEDPSHVVHEGVELRLAATIESTSLFGILDRLDRDEAGDLVIVDYKTGGLPNRDYDAKTFANTELYAALCEAKLGERPRRIRLMYVAKGETIERPVTEVVARARVANAVSAWERIKVFYDEGAFPARPSRNTCRFCAYTETCRASGVPVPEV
ncbi:MAG: RecB family exonuclease [Acidimicrobiales bacterium]